MQENKGNLQAYLHGRTKNTVLAEFFLQKLNKGGAAKRRIMKDRYIIEVLKKLAKVWSEFDFKRFRKKDMQIDALMRKIKRTGLGASIIGEQTDYFNPPNHIRIFLPYACHNFDFEIYFLLDEPERRNWKNEFDDTVFHVCSVTPGHYCSYYIEQRVKAKIMSILDAGYYDNMDCQEILSILRLGKKKQ